MSKVQPVKIEIRRAEGRTDECTDWKAYESFADADRMLGLWARTAPKDGSYHKCDFRVTYADGETYEGRFDLVFKDLHGTELLERHMRDHVTFSAGVRCPGHISEADYARYLNEIVGAECMASYRKFLDSYEMGGE